MHGKRVAIYCRLSREDGLDESQSIAMQKKSLEDYVVGKGWKLHKIYVDDGYSGTNFDRPGFRQMLYDIEHGYLDIVLVKDLSRLGRNYVQTGYYTEEYFPDHNIRFIAINDNFDSLDECGNEFVPFKNIINEWYAKDISKKIRFTLDNKAKKGEAKNTVFPIFGYKYNEKYERVPDEETSPIVKLIFKKYIEFGSSTKVASYLTENEVKTPSYYNAIKYNYNKQKILKMHQSQWCHWTGYSVRDIISKREYLGDYITSKTKSKDFKNKKRYKNKDCFVFTERYKPIVEKEIWESANKIRINSRAGRVPTTENLFKGIVCCANCGKVMRFEKRVDKHKKDKFCCRYYCSNPNCSTTNSITKDRLRGIIENEFLFLKDKIVANFNEISTFFIDFLSKKNNFLFDYENEIKKIQDKNDMIDQYLKTLFEDKCNNKIPLSTYDYIFDKYLNEKEINLSRISNLQSAQCVGLQKQKALNLERAVDFKLNFSSLNKIIKKIFVSSSSINGSCKNFNYEINIIYPRSEIRAMEF